MALVGFSHNLVRNELAAIGLRNSLLQSSPFLIAQMIDLVIKLRFEGERDLGELFLPLGRPRQHTVEKLSYLIFGHRISLSDRRPARFASIQRAAIVTTLADRSEAGTSRP
jgi:hypothetical protein